MIIVTGAAGLIGSAVIWRLNCLDREDILVVDHMERSEKWKNLSPLKFRDYLEKDAFYAMLQRDELAAVYGHIDAIIHLGACSSTTEQDASYMIANNFEYTKQLAQFALRNDIRFIYASSAATYGDGLKGFCEDADQLHELRPLNMYGYSKHMFDMWARANGVLDRMVGLKYFNVYGPNEYHKGEMRSLVLKAYEQIVDSGTIKLFRSHRPDYKDGEQMRDFLYVKDAADMTLHFLENRTASGIFNLGSGEANTWNRLAAGIFKALDRPFQIEYIDMPDSIREKYQYYTCADTGKLKAAGYIQPLNSLEGAVEDYVLNYLVPGKRLGE